MLKKLFYCPHLYLWTLSVCFLSGTKLYSAVHTINFSTWIDFENFNASDPGLDTGESQDGIGLLKALNAVGASPTALFGDASADTTYNGDLIELGFFKDLGADDAIGGGDDSASSDAFKGLWTPLTSKTTIGHDASIITSMVPIPTTTEYVIPNGEFGFNVVINNNNSPKDDDTAYINPGGANTNYSIDDQLSTDGGHLDISANYALLEAATNPLLGIRFYDINKANFTSGGTTKATDGSTRYNTIMDAAWVWPGDGSSPLNMAIYEKGSGAATPTLDSSLLFEFDNTDAHTANVAKVGTGDTRVENDDYVATVTYHDGTSNLALNTIGSSVISGLSGSGTLTDNGSGKTLTLHSQTGNTVADAYSFGGTITGDTTVIKTGEGEQKLTSTLSVTDTTGFVYIDDGILNLAPVDGGGGVNQSMEYLTSATSLGSKDPIFALDNDNDADQTVTFGLTDSSHESTDREFKGKVYLSDSGTNTVEVSSNSASGDYAKTQILSGVISGSSGGTAQAGSAKLKKTGKGRLKLSGANTFNGGVDIDDGTLVVGHNTGAGSGTVTINKGKLEVSSNVTNMANTIQGGSGKSLIGGDGTVASVTIGSDANEVDYLSPGQGVSSSLTPSQKQVGLGNGTANDAIGSFTATNLSLLGGGVYDWEIQDFDGTTGGTDYDVMNFTNLTFGSSSDRFTINIMGIQSSDGTAGAPDNLASIWGKSRQGAGSGSTNGFKFLAGNSGTINWGGWANDGSDINDYFEFRFDDLAWNTSNNGQYNQWGQDWSVLYSGGDFYLQFSAAPEPSTYIMVTGLFMLPGYRWIKRFRKKIKSTDSEFDEV